MEDRTLFPEFGKPIKEQTAETFAQFWSLYPRRVARAHALSMWNRLTTEEQTAALAALPRHIELWRREKTEITKIPHPGTWLNPKLGRRWEDEIPAKDNGTHKQIGGVDHGKWGKFIKNRRGGEGDAGAS